MRVFVENGDAADRARLLGKIKRKRQAAEQRRREAARFDGEADDLQVTADAIARMIGGATAETVTREGAA